MRCMGKDGGDHRQPLYEGTEDRSGGAHPDAKLRCSGWNETICDGGRRYIHGVLRQQGGRYKLRRIFRSAGHV
nr:MAG TPA: hypothetical protein [Caudoviricetes sp.]